MGGGGCRVENRGWHSHFVNVLLEPPYICKPHLGSTADLRPPENTSEIGRARHSVRAASVQ